MKPKPEKPLKVEGVQLQNLIVKSARITRERRRQNYNGYLPPVFAKALVLHCGEQTRPTRLLKLFRRVPEDSYLR